MGWRLHSKKKESYVFFGSPQQALILRTQWLHMVWMSDSYHCWNESLLTCVSLSKWLNGESHVCFFLTYALGESKETWRKDTHYSYSLFQVFLNFADRRFGFFFPLPAVILVFMFLNLFHMCLLILDIYLWCPSRKWWLKRLCHPPSFSHYPVNT